jgi:hypothetical protein
LLREEAGSGGERSEEGSGWDVACERGSCESRGLKDGRSEHVGQLVNSRCECLSGLPTIDSTCHVI